jgi:hypothetical protein
MIFTKVVYVFKSISLKNKYLLLNLPINISFKINE